MLHLVQSRAGLAKCKAFVQSGDDVVFIGDGVICSEPVANCRVFIQADDAMRYGVPIADESNSCSMAELVELVALHDQSVSWS